MKRQDLIQPLAYILVSSVSVGGAFLVSSHFIAKAKAQDESVPAPASPPATTGEAASPMQNASAPGEVPTTKAEPDSVLKSAGITDVENFLEPFIYDIVNRRDPFQTYAEYVIIEDSGGKGGLTPAQRFDLEKMKLIGILWDVKEPKAMFLDPDDEVRVLGRDESIGNRNGYIAEIREGEVIVVESVRKRGDVSYHTKVLHIER